MSHRNKKPGLAAKIKTGLKRSLGILIVVFVLAFVFYHLYSVANFAKNFNRSTGIGSKK